MTEPQPHKSSLHPIIALAVLEAVRASDRPEDDSPVSEVQDETVKLGRTRSVAAQIERYANMAKEGDGLQPDELASLFTLVSRRVDAKRVFADAGRRAGRHAAQRTSGVLRLARAALPQRLRELLGRSLVRRAAARVLSLDVGAGCVRATTANECPASMSPGGRACALYGAGLAELLRAFTSFDSACFLTTCQARGGKACTWNTEREFEE